MRTNTIFCRKTGIQVTYLTKYQEGNYSTLKEHPQLDILHKIVNKYKRECDKEYIAGAILHNLHSAKLLAFSEHYPNHLMAEFNLNLQKIDSHSLFSLYQTVATYCFNITAGGKRVCQLNLASITSGQWTFLTALQALMGLTNDEVPGCARASATQIVKAMMAKRERELLTLQSLKESKDTGSSMSLREIMRRIKKLLNSAKRTNPEMFDAWSEDFGWSYRDACYKLTNYTDLKMETRQMLSIYLDKQLKLIELNDIEQRSVAKIKELLKAEDIKPLELANDDSWLDEGF